MRDKIKQFLNEKNIKNICLILITFSLLKIAFWGINISKTVRITGDTDISGSVSVDGSIDGNIDIRSPIEIINY